MIDLLRPFRRDRKPRPLRGQPNHPPSAETRARTDQSLNTLAAGVASTLPVPTTPPRMRARSAPHIGLAIRNPSHPPPPLSPNVVPRCTCGHSNLPASHPANAPHPTPSPRLRPPPRQERPRPVSLPPGTEHPQTIQRPTTFHATLAPPSPTTLSSTTSSPSLTAVSKKRNSFDPRLAAWDAANASRTLPPRHSSITTPPSPLTSSPAVPSSLLTRSPAQTSSPVAPSPDLRAWNNVDPAQMSSSPALSAASSPGVQIPPLPPGAQAPALVGWVAKEARHRPSEPELLQPESLSPVSHMSKRQSFPAVPHMRLSSRSPGLSTSPLPSPSPELVQPTPRRPWGGQSTPPATSTPFAFRSARLSVSTLGGSPLSQSPAANSTRLSSPDKAGMPDPDAHTPHNRSTHDLASTPRGGTRLPVSTIANSLPAAKPGYVSSPQAKPVPPTTAKARATQPGKPRSIAASNPEHTFHPQPPLLPPGAAALPLKISAALAGVPLTAGPTTGPAPVTSTTTLSTSLALPKPTAEASTSTRPASAPSLAKPAGNPLTSHPQPVPTLLPGMRPARAPPIVRPIPLHINTAYRDIDAGRLFVPSGLPKEPPAYDPNWAVDTDPGRPEKGVFQH